MRPRIFAVGGAELDLENDCISMERYFWGTNTWKPVHNILKFRKEFCAVHLKNQLIIIGGEDKLGVQIATVR